MSSRKKDIPYDSFEGAGGPNNPPPQKPDTNPTKQRLIMLIVGYCSLPIPLIAFSTIWSLPILLLHFISGLCGGVIIAIYDWIIEAYAHQKGLWFCYGGYQKIKELDFKHVPIDMVIGFISLGINLAFASHIPFLFRGWRWDVLGWWAAYFPALDIVWIIILLVFLSLFGAFADFQSKKQGIWMNGPTWTYWKCAFYAWLPLLTSGIIVDHLIYFLLTL